MHHIVRTKIIFSDSQTNFFLFNSTTENLFNDCQNCHHHHRRRTMFLIICRFLCLDLPLGSNHHHHDVMFTTSL
ncbi:hypothetical protein DERF_006625 [Dermatophagoides farinae]|uniref:Uncharacterized protein n=1 Tax=Dermatophagoides farinae TaxID=6954 RepID=A0A922I0J3_DERFA|nr:hypothetical protein DERF_006625 [Dermatophagoides farinae]